MGYETPVRAADLLARLREETRGLHKAVEGRHLIAGLMSDDLTPQRYATCLSRLEQFHAALEPAIAAQLSKVAGLDLADRQKTAALRRDLAHFGGGPAEPLAPISFATAAAAWGALYVIEGASLGGMVISRRLCRHDWLCQPAGRAHFAGYGPLTGQMWARFRTELVAAAAGDDRFADAAIAGARQTFLRLDALLVS
jgi:heme oxygenase